MKLLSEPLLIPLTAPLYHGKGTLFLAWGISRECMLVHYSKLFVSSGCFPCGQSLGLDSTFSSLFPASCAQSIPWKCCLVPYLPCHPTLFLWVPFIPHFQPKIKTRRNIQQYSLFKKVYFYQ